MEVPEGGWEPQCFYVVEVSFRRGNPEHRSLFYSGFLTDSGVPSGYNAIFNPSYDQIFELKDVKHIKVIQRLGALLKEQTTMKRTFRSKDGQFITAKEWFLENDTLHISCVSVDKSFKTCEQTLAKMLQFQTESLSKVEMALVAAASIIVYQGDNPAITIYSNGNVQMWGGTFSSAGMSYRPELLQRFKDVMTERIKEQQVIVDKANATFVEVQD